jgi:DNA-binding response OmpR family regulator
MAKLLIVEDEPGIAFALESDLTLEGYEVNVVSDGVEGLRRARAEPFDLILLDVILPNKDGFDICRELRRGGSHTPIILLTARAQDAEKVMGLDLGADDYVTKPFSPRELRARISAVLRRTMPEKQRSNANRGEEIYSFGAFEVDMERFELRRAGQRVGTTPTELRLLAVLVRSRGRALTRDQLLDQVWGSGVHVTDRVIDNHVVSLRKKIEDDPGTPRHLVSVRSVGYRFDA